MSHAKDMQISALQLEIAQLKNSNHSLQKDHEKALDKLERMIINKPEANTNKGQGVNDSVLNNAAHLLLDQVSGKV